MLDRLDSLLLSLHQKLVDFTQLEPSKLSGWFLKLTLMFYAIRIGLLINHGVTGWGWVIIGLSPLVIGIAIYTRMVALSTNGAGVELYRLFFVFSVILPFAMTPSGIASQLKVVAEMMMIYIASCHKPKPPKRKNRVSRVLHHST